MSTEGGQNHFLFYIIIPIARTFLIFQNKSKGPLTLILKIKKVFVVRMRNVYVEYIDVIQINVLTTFSIYPHITQATVDTFI